MANYHGYLEAVDCHIHSVRYDSGLEVSSCGHPQFGNIRSPTMLLFSSVWSRRDYVQIYLEFFFLYSINSLELASRVLDVARIAVPDNRDMYLSLPYPENAGRDLLGRDGTYFHCHAAAAELTNIPIRVVGLSLGTDVFLLMISDERF